MKKKKAKIRRYDFREILLAILIVALPLILLGVAIGFEIYVWTTYGSMPVSEIPTWALLFMFGRR